MDKIKQDESGRFIIPHNLIGIRETKMKQLINETVDRHDGIYRLYLELNKSNLPDYYDIRFFSTYSGASNPDAEQTKWKSTLPKSALENLQQSLKTILGE